MNKFKLFLHYRYIDSELLDMQVRLTQLSYAMLDDEGKDKFLYLAKKVKEVRIPFSDRAVELEKEFINHFGGDEGDVIH